MNLAKNILGTLGIVLMLSGICLLSSDFASSLFQYLISGVHVQSSDPHLFAQIHLLAKEALFRGLLLIFLGWMVLPKWRNIKAFLQNNKKAISIAALLLAIIWLPIVIFGHSTMIAGARYWWLGDDAMISMRYAHNLVQGNGLVWNPGERVEGFTNFLWTIYMALVHLLPISISKTSLIILLTNIVLAIAAMPIMVKLTHLLGGGDLATTGILASYVMSKNLLAWTTSGFETTLFMVLFLYAVYRVLYEAKIQRPTLITYFIISLLSLVRADALVLSGLLYVVSVLLQPNKKRVITYSAISLIVPLSQVIFRLYYYGEIIPNTAYLKTSHWQGRYSAGIDYVAGFAWHYVLIISVAVLGIIRSDKRSCRLLLAACFIYAIYVAYAGGDAFGNYRFFAPILPLLLILAFVAIAPLTKRQIVRLVLAIICFVSLPLLPLSYLNILKPSPFDVGNIKIGLLLKQNTPVDCKIADCWAGSVFYFSERYGIDMLGKMDPHIARTHVLYQGTMPGHNKFDYDYSLGKLKPDIVIANFKMPVKEEEMRAATRGDWAFTGQLYFHPLFQKHCLPNLITLPTARSIFICDWSTVNTQKTGWRDIAGKE